jgi:hypothetical protein
MPIPSHSQKKRGSFRFLGISMLSNDEVERRGIAPTQSEGTLSQSFTIPLAHRSCGPRSLEPIVRGGIDISHRNKQHNSARPPLGRSRTIYLALANCGSRESEFKKIAAVHPAIATFNEWIGVSGLATPEQVVETIDWDRIDETS